MRTEALANKRLQFYDMDVQMNQTIFARDVAHGLGTPQKWLPPKYFYDERGSRLYEQICTLPEYYPYRAEQEILSAYATQIHAEIGHLALVEFGSGSATKTRHLLAAYEWAGRPFSYCPVDIARQVLWDTANRLLQEYSYAEIRAMHADFSGQPEVIRSLPTEEESRGFFRVQSRKLHAGRKRRVPAAYS